MITQSKTETVTKTRTSAHRDHEIVEHGFEGYFKVAKNVTRRRYAYIFPHGDELDEAAALAATVALYELGPNSTLNQVARLVSRTLYQEAKSEGWRKENYRQSNGKRSSRWVKYERGYGYGGLGRQYS